ncbi:MAG: Mss4p nuclear export [Tremellales sp. Tagirdzhanova-0007]|nr:MAG: Mss4p nuclear export [Tremellales sp. Tagirdzhanova-0007]
MPMTKPQLQALPASSASTKRKTMPGEDDDGESSGSDGDSDSSIVNVDFDFYNLNLDVDQIATKRLLRQTLSHDEELIDVHPLASLILSEGVRLSAGSSIKTDGEESDPWGIIAVIDVARNRDNPAFRPFLDYLTSTLPPKSPIRTYLEVSPSNAIHTPAVIFSLRLLNLPLPLIPPMYKMLLTELKQDESPKFSHWLLWGRGYRLEGSEKGMGLQLDTAVQSKKKRKKAAQEVISLPSGSFPYHPEEEFIDKIATHIHTFPFKSAPKRDEESFGVEQFGRLVLIERDRLPLAIESMEAACQ